MTETRRLEDLSQWPDLAEISGTLAEHYSAALDVDVDGQPSDYLLWDGIDVVANYAGPMHPDVEHVSLAMLGAEGAAPILISANWDPLVERAYDLLFGSRTSLPRRSHRLNSSSSMDARPSLTRMKIGIVR